MKNLMYKILSVPVVAYMLTMISVAVMGTFVDRTWIKENLDNNAMPIWLGWIAVSLLIISIHHFLIKREK